MIRKLLIANRGEIACRIIRTARSMGVATVAVFSDADMDALHVSMADEAVRIGGALPAQSYLDAAVIIDAALMTGADAVHPGYGFLSENAGFAEACLSAGLTFVGPPPHAIQAMGDKARAKELMRQAGVPVVPGYSGQDQSGEGLAEAARGIGFPLLIKAAAGGGGRGMRRVDSEAQFAAALDSARREASNVFGDNKVLLEKLIVDARHIEIQVFADGFGNCIHLGERDCSTQRRHQKIVEEAPSPFVNADLRAEMGDAAVRAARAVNYVGAGTVEFIVGTGGAYHFLEMNTRLQVEHPVTEMITGFDLVEWQLRIAGGEPLVVGQDGVKLDGHAIEVRLYAEDPYAGFQPQGGVIGHWRPDSIFRTGVRIDNGVLENAPVSSFYDPMVAKVIAHGKDRREALARLGMVLRDLPLLGIPTNRGFLIDLLGRPEFASGAMTTGMIDQWVAKGDSILARPQPTESDIALAACIQATAGGGNWFRSSGIAKCPITLTCGERSTETIVCFERGRIVGVLVGERMVAVDAIATRLPAVRATIGGVTRSAIAVIDGRTLWLDARGHTFKFLEPDRLAAIPAMSDASRIVSPIAGLVRLVHKSPGERVGVGEALIVVEAMKMEMTLTAQAAGVVSDLYARAGDQVRAGDVLAELAIDLHPVTV